MKDCVTKVVGLITLEMSWTKTCFNAVWNQIVATLLLFYFLITVPNPFTDPYSFARLSLFLEPGTCNPTPFGSIFDDVVQVFVQGNAKDAPNFEFLYQWNDAIVKKQNSPLYQSLVGSFFGSTCDKHMIHLYIHLLVPFDLHVPMLHRMRDIGYY